VVGNLYKLIISILIIIGIIGCNYNPKTPNNNIKNNKFRLFEEQKAEVKIKRTLVGYDQDKDGIDDLEDIVLGARAEANRQPTYKNAYYNGGYPPENEGVCTDVIWRAFKDAGYNLKSLVDKDIKNKLQAYPRVNGQHEPNIDFRRVPNLVSFFKRNGTSLSSKIIPNNLENLKNWQGGDIVVFGAPLWHIGIVSDKRRPDGVPLLIHNGGPYAMENDMLLDWPTPITLHFRFPKKDKPN
jgi:uncharacterized protein